MKFFRCIQKNNYKKNKIKLSYYYFTMGSCIKNQKSSSKIFRISPEIIIENSSKNLKPNPNQKVTVLSNSNSQINSMLNNNSPTSIRRKSSFFHHTNSPGLKVQFEEIKKNKVESPKNFSKRNSVMMPPQRFIKETSLLEKRRTSEVRIKYLMLKKIFCFSMVSL